MTKVLPLPLLFILLSLPGCAWFQESPPLPAAELASEARGEFAAGQYTTALELFEELMDRFPFSSYSLMAELKIADCHYYQGHYGEAIAAYESFQENHPANEANAYALFQVAMSHYNQIDTIDRDPAGAHNAIAVFNRLIRTYPKSPYVEESRARVAAARNFLANHELYVASYYLKTDRLQQAAGRLQFLLDNYPESTAAPEAKRTLALLKEGRKPEGSWRDWLPEIGLPDWETFKDVGGPR
ncbi:MAG: outer membrane protein assembly factor BamD [Thermodesulfobacteriota bacterium]